MWKITLAMCLMVGSITTYAQDHSAILNGATIEDEAIDTNGFIYLTGTTQGSLPVVNPFQPDYAGDTDGFVAKLSPDGQTIIYSSYLGGTGIDKGQGIDVDSAGNAYVGGWTDSFDFPVLNALQPVDSEDIFSGFIAKVAPSGSLIYSTYFSGQSNTEIHAVTVDAVGNTYVAGHTDSPIPNAGNSKTPGSDPNDDTTFYDAFIAKLDPAGTQIIYAWHLGGSDYDDSDAIILDDLGQAMVTGLTNSANFPTFPQSPDACALNGSDPFAAKMTAAGDGVIYITCGYAPQPEGLVTVGLYDATAGNFLLRNEQAGGPADSTFQFGPSPSPYLPLVGDWNNNGQATVGLYDSDAGMFFLHNSHATGDADIQFRFGPEQTNWLPIAGDWDGDGTVTVGLYDPDTSMFFLRNSHDQGTADIQFRFGPPGFGWLPLVGDWDGNGEDTVGVYDPFGGRYYLRNRLAPGPADLAFRFGVGNQGWLPLTGDWDNDGVDTVGAYAPLLNRFYLRNRHAGGSADVAFRYGPVQSGWLPITGDWDGE